MNCRQTMLGVVCVAGCALAHAQAPVGDLSAVDASVKGAVTMTAGGMRVMSGSSITAGQSTAFLRLVRGGELRVCPHASLAVTASPNGNQLMLAMNSGAVETHYRLGSVKDTIVTPDFRIQLIGPGEFHVAVSADGGGNACVRTLEQNTAAVVIEEQLGDGVRQLAPREQASFHNGSVKDPEMTAVGCGCPEASSALAAQPQPIPLLENDDLKPTPGADVHVQIDAPFVFNAEEQEAPPPPPLAQLKLSTVPPLLGDVPLMLPPRKGVFGRVRSWIGRVFR